MVAIGQAEIQPPPPALNLSGPSMFGKNATVEQAQESDFLHTNGNTYYNKVVLSFPGGVREHGECQCVQSVIPDPIDTLNSTISTVLKETKKHSKLASVSAEETNGVGGSSALLWARAITETGTNQEQTEVVEMTGVGDGSASLPQAVVMPDAEVDEMVPSDPSSLPVPTSLADKYTRTMLKCLAGYPLYKPAPYNDSLTNYMREGISPGDVGFIRENGAFDFLFNIRPSQNGLINPPDLQNGFTLLESTDSRIKSEMEFARETCRFYHPVYRTKGLLGCTKYTSSESDGAILELPEGATRFEVTEKLPFKELAIRNGVEWYKYTMSRGRDITNGSLYLVTSCTKCIHWGIAVVERPCLPREGVRFIHNRKPFRHRPPSYYWKGSSSFTTMSSPAPDADHETVLNQCIFLRGYKIKLREDIWNGINQERRRGNAHMPMSPSSPHQTARQPEGAPSNQDNYRQSMVGSMEPPRTSELVVADAGGHSGEPTKPDLPIIATPVMESEEVIVHTDFNSPPVHPSDLINAALLNQVQGAKIAVTHDDAWCDLLRDISLNPKHLDLATISRAYTSIIDENGCVSFEKVLDPRSCPEIETGHRQQPTGSAALQELDPATSDNIQIPLPQMPDGSGNTNQSSASTPITLRKVPAVNEDILPRQEPVSAAVRKHAHHRLPTKAANERSHLPTPHAADTGLGAIGEGSTSAPVILPADPVPSLKGIKSPLPQERASTEECYVIGGQESKSHIPAIVIPEVSAVNENTPRQERASRAIQKSVQHRFPTETHGHLPTPGMASAVNPSPEQRSDRSQHLVQPQNTYKRIKVSVCRLFRRFHRNANEISTGHEQADDRSQHLIQLRNTYKQFKGSVRHLFRRFNRNASEAAPQREQPQVAPSERLIRLRSRLAKMYILFKLFMRRFFRGFRRNANETAPQCEQFEIDHQYGISTIDDQASSVHPIQFRSRLWFTYMRFKFFVLRPFRRRRNSIEPPISLTYSLDLIEPPVPWQLYAISSSSDHSMTDRIGQNL